MVSRWTGAALALAVACAIGSCGAEPRWLEVTRVEPARSGDRGGALLFLNQDVTVHFNEPIDPGSVSPESLRMVDERGHAVAGKLEVGRRSIRFRPVPPVTPGLADGSFRPGGRYRLEIPGLPTIYAIRSAGGRSLARGRVLWFEVPPQPGALGLLTLFLPVDAGADPLMLDISTISSLRMAADAPELDLHFTRPLLPESVQPEAFRFLRVVTGREQPEVVRPSRAEVVPRHLPFTRHFGCTVRLEFDAEVGLAAGDLVYLTFAESGSGLLDYRRRPLLSPDVPLQVRIDPGDRRVVGDLDIAELELEPTGRVPLGFEVRNGRMVARARAEAGSGRHGLLEVTADTSLVVGEPFVFPGGVEAPVPDEIELLGLDVASGAELRIRSDRRIVLRVCGPVRIAGRLVLETPRAEVPWPAGTDVEIEQLVRAAGFALVAGERVEILGSVHHERPDAEGAPWVVASATGVVARGGLPRDSVIALEREARFEGYAENALLLSTAMTPGLPDGVELEAEAWTPWLPLPISRTETIDVHIVDPRGELQLQMFLAPARALASGAAIEDLPLLAIPVNLPAVTPFVAPAGSMLRLEMRAQVRGATLPSFGGFTVHEHR